MNLGKTDSSSDYSPVTYTLGENEYLVGLNSYYQEFEFYIEGEFEFQKVYNILGYFGLVVAENRCYPDLSTCNPEI